MANAARKPAKAARAAAGSGLWLSGLACGAVLAFAPALAVLAAALLAPAGIAAVLESHTGRPVTRAMALSGGTFVLAPCWRLVREGLTMTNVLDQLADPLTAGAAWFAGIVGWALCELLPVALQAASDLRVAARVKHLEDTAKSLRASWDLPDAA